MKTRPDARNEKASPNMPLICEKWKNIREKQKNKLTFLFLEQNTISIVHLEMPLTPDRFCNIRNGPKLVFFFLLAILILTLKITLLLDFGKVFSILLFPAFCFDLQKRFVTLFSMQSWNSKWRTVRSFVSCCFAKTLALKCWNMQ